MRLKNKRIYLGLSILLLLMGWLAFVTISRPYLGVTVEKNASQKWVVSELSQKGVGQHHFLIGDEILSIDNKLPGENQSVQNWGSLNKSTSIEIFRNQEVLRIDFGNKGITLYDATSIFESIFCMLLAGIIFVRIPNSPSAGLLAVVFLSGAVIYMSQGASIRGEGLAKLSIETFLTVLPILFFHFLIAFFKEKSEIHLPKKTLILFYVFAFAEFLFRLPYLFSNEWTKIVHKIAPTASLALFIITFVYNLGFLVYLYFKHGRNRTYLASIIKSIWYALFVSFLPIVSLSFLPMIFTGDSIVDAVYTSWFLLLFPASFAYLIASDQLYDIGLVFRRFLFGCLLAVVPSSLITGLFSAMFHQTATKQMIVFVFASTLLALALMLYSTEYLTTRLEPIFFPRKAMLKTSLKKISKNLSTVSTMREMKDIFLADIVQTVEVRGGAIVCQYPDSVEAITAGELDAEEIKSLLAEHELFDNDHYTCLEISRTEESTNYLVMTRKRTNVLLSREEQQWLSLITSYLEVSLENVHLIRTLTTKLQDLSSRFSDDTSAVEFQWFRKVMFELQEEERIRIASDLHDTTMQDLFFLKRRFAGLMEKYVMNREDKEHLDNILKFVDLINASLRQSCFELNPHLLREIGLVATLRQYLEKEAYMAPFHIHYEPGNGTARIEQEPLINKRHLLRIVQELLNNAKKHSQASKVSFRLSATPQQFQLIYEDDGIGIRPMEPGMREIGGSGVGMEQMKGRILLMQGSMKMKESSGPGVHMTISIPLHEQEHDLNRKSM
ncbi:MAG: hypothetical protein K0Q90_1655 [Paenibacillaceae bacterium]|jgi:two-component system sensor histidine kinase ComP|nr:hypothetical protein [Paenibacillaceae bacterium]